MSLTWKKFVIWRVDGDGIIFCAFSARFLISNLPGSESEFISQVCCSGILCKAESLSPSQSHSSLSGVISDNGPVKSFWNKSFRQTNVALLFNFWYNYVFYNTLKKKKLPFSFFFFFLLPQHNGAHIYSNTVIAIKIQINNNSDDFSFLTFWHTIHSLPVNWVILQ